MWYREKIILWKMVLRLLKSVSMNKISTTENWQLRGLPLDWRRSPPPCPLPCCRSLVLKELLLPVWSKKREDPSSSAPCFSDKTDSAVSASANTTYANLQGKIEYQISTLYNRVVTNKECVNIKQENWNWNPKLRGRHQNGSDCIK